MPKKITIQDVQTYIDENSGGQCTLLSTTYLGAKKPLIFKCNQCNNTFERSFFYVKMGRFLCPSCAQKTKNVQRHTIEDVKNFIKKNDVNHECELISTEYKNNTTPLELKCNLCGKFFTRDFEHIKRHRFCCPQCGIHNGAIYQPKGGIALLSESLRSCTQGWKKKCLKEHPYCDISGATRDLEVHHLVNFSVIVQEAIINLGFEKRSPLIQDYSKEELNSLHKEVSRLHEQKAKGVVLTKALHKEFHHVYGNNNTEEQYLEFKAKKGLELNGISNNRSADNSTG